MAYYFHQKEKVVKVIDRFLIKLFPEVFFRYKVFPGKLTRKVVGNSYDSCKPSFSRLRYRRDLWYNGKSDYYIEQEEDFMCKRMWLHV